MRQFAADDYEAIRKNMESLRPGTSDGHSNNGQGLPAIHDGSMSKDEQNKVAVALNCLWSRTFLEVRESWYM
jgi:hypothetical protein